MFAIMQTDRAIIRSVLQGRTDRFGLLVDRYGRLAYAVAYAYLRNPHDAEEVVQESFTRLYERLDTLSWKQNIGPWLAQVARNAAVDRLRKRGREALVASQSPDSLVHFPNPARDEMRRVVSDELQHLDPAEREVLLLHYFLGKKAREIALLLDIQPEAAAKRLQRARDELGRRLVDVLKEDLAEDRAEPARRRNVMAAIAATAIPWKPSAAAAATLSVATGVTAAKVTLVVAGSAIVLATLAIGGYHYLSKPYSTKEITAASSFKTEPAPQKSAANPVPAADTTAAATDQKEANVAESSPEKKPSISAPVVGLRIYGLVLSEDRQAVPGATVFIDDAPLQDVYRALEEAGGEPPDTRPMNLSAVTDAQGRFDIASVPYNSLFRGFFGARLWCRQGGLAACAPLDLTATATERYYELTLTQEGALAGLVTDMQGNPINRACVMLRDSQAKKEIRFLPTDRAFTGKDGRFAFEFLPASSYRFNVDATNYAPLETPWIATGESNLVFQLDTGDSISGRVVEDATGKALPHVGVHARQRVEYNYRVAAADTDDAGRFTITGLIPGTFLLTINRTKEREDTPYAVLQPLSVDVQAGRPVTGVELRAVLGATISGHVVESATGQPPRQAGWVHATDPGTMPWQRSVKVEKDGSYALCGVPPGEHKLLAGVLGSDGVSAEKSVSVRDATPITGIDFVVGKAGKNTPKDQALTGRVVDASGVGVENASVVATPADHRESEASALTDSSGEFAITFDNRQVPAKVYVQAFAAGAMSRRQGPMAPLGSNCTLTLESAGRIEGTVFDDSGSAVSGAVVSAVGDDDAASITAANAPWRAMDQIRGTKAATSDTGAFVMPSVIAGAYQLEVYIAGGDINVPVAKAAARVSAGETLRTRLVIDTRQLGAIEGTVTVNGSPVPDTHLNVWAVDDPWLNSIDAYTDSSGHYVIPHVQAGKARVTAEIMPSSRTAAGHTQHVQIVEVETGKTATADFTLNSQKTGAVEGRVYVNEAPSPYAYLEFKPAEGGEDPAGNSTAQTGNDGAFRIEGLAEGVYTVVARTFIQHALGSFQLAEEQEVTIVAGDTAHLEFHLSAGRIEGTLSGISKDRQAFVSLLDGSFNPFSMTPQILMGMEEKVLTVMALPKDGSFFFENIPPGNYVIGAVAVPENTSQRDPIPAIEAITAGKYAAAQIQVASGQTTTIDLALP